MRSWWQSHYPYTRWDSDRFATHTKYPEFSREHNIVSNVVYTEYPL